ncbi:MAG: glutamate formimidoyltransferase [Methanobacteriota archaeon]|nr:MAG: glutamate formimidoyltransferase [Euryarchaeota archaeon]
MGKLVECVPNFSEGRRKEVIDTIIEAITSVKGVQLLDKEMDPDHNRAVITFIGEIEPVKKAACAAAAKAVELIDMEKHRGEHPRIGAVDVVPFIPLADTTMEECVRLAREVGRWIGEKLKVPVYLYEEAATRPEFRDLANVRKGEYEGLKRDIEVDPSRKPDFGPSKLHPTAGATAVGARMPLIAYNVYLGTHNVEIARRIAKAVRFRDGGLRYVKAMGFEIKEKGLVQVSMNLVNYRSTPIYRVFELIRSEAKRYGVQIVGSEIVGLVPLQALVDVASFYLGLEGFSVEQILEVRMGGGGKSEG